MKRYAIVTRDRFNNPNDNVHYFPKGTLVQVQRDDGTYLRVEAVGMITPTAPGCEPGQYTQTVEAEDLLFMDNTTSAAIESEFS